MLHPFAKEAFLALYVGIGIGVVFTLFFTGKLESINFDRKLLYKVITYIVIGVILGLIIT